MFPLVLTLVACSSASAFTPARLRSALDATEISTNTVALARLSDYAPLNDDDKRAIRNAGFDVARGAEIPGAGSAPVRRVLALLFHSDDGAAQVLGIVRSAALRGGAARPAPQLGDDSFSATLSGGTTLIGYRRANVVVVATSLDLASAVDEHLRAPA